MSVRVSKSAAEIAIAESSITARWNGGTGTSGDTGADLISIGAAGARYKIHSLLVDIGALTTGATITIRLYMKINGTERRIYPPITQSNTFVVGTDADGIWVINGSLVIDQILRVEVQSNNSNDDNKSIGYKINSEVM